MGPVVTRRGFLFGIGAATAGLASAGKTLGSLIEPPLYPPITSDYMSAFKISVFSDEITQDLGRALEIVAGEFGLGYVELRGMWGKNIMRLDDKEIEEARRLLERYKLRVSSIAGPLFKVDWPGAPVSKFSPPRDQFNADFTFEQQGEVLERGIELARAFNTGNLRCFDFWRLDDQKPYREAIDEKLIDAATIAGRRGITLVMENEYACNTATAVEAARTLSAVRSANFKLNWDPGNSGFSGETPYPNGYTVLPKDRIGHVHCKDVRRKSEGGYEWMKMGGGFIDFVGQFRALKKDGYRGAVVLETHWRGAGTPEESTRQSMAGMKELLRRAEAL